MKRTIGRTGVEVNAIGLGAWPLSNHGRPSAAEGIDLVCRAVEAGVELIDTADCYAADDSEFGHNERLVRAALDRLGPGCAVKVATKVGFRRPGGRWVPDAHPARIKRCCEASLERLGVESIFLYQLHTPDPAVPLADTIGALCDLKDRGEVQHIGVSNVSLAELEAAQSLTRIESVQNECSPWVQGDRRSGLIARCGETGVAYLPYRPVGGKDGHRRLAREPVLGALAEKYTVTPYRIALAWLLHLGDHVLPIPGATRFASVLDNLAATEVEMDAADLERVSAL